jgi:alkylhydroperoxidase family enzyme
MQHHLASSKRAGLTEADWKALKNPAGTELPVQTKAALTYAEKLTRAPWEIKEEDVAALKQHFSDEQIVDLDLLVGLVNLTNRFTDPLGLELEFAAEKI